MCVFLFNLCLLLFFFFKQKTAYEMRISDWSSDVCSSDLAAGVRTFLPAGPSAQRCPASCRPAAASALRSRSQDPSVAGPRTLPARHTSTSSCRSLLRKPVSPGQVSGLRAGLRLLQHPDDLLLGKPDRKSTRLNSSH